MRAIKRYILLEDFYYFIFTNCKYRKWDDVLVNILSSILNCRWKIIIILFANFLAEFKGVTKTAHIIFLVQQETRKTHMNVKL